MRDGARSNPGGEQKLTWLSKRERQIASAYARGLNYREIAERLCIAPATVRTHLGTIYRKLGVSTKIGLLDAIREAAVEEGREENRGKDDSAPAPSAQVGKRQVTVLCALLVETPAIAEGEIPRPRPSSDGFCAGPRPMPWRGTGVGCSMGGNGMVAACFGTPYSDETDQERAVSCALDIAECWARDRRPAFTLRIGVSTGPVVAGGERNGELWGGVPRLAAALARNANGSGVFACARTRAALGNLFAFCDLGEVEMERGTTLTRCFSVGPALGFGTRFAASHGDRLPPIVGRDHEVGLLQTLFAAALGGAGQVAVIAGEPGVGKSRTVRALTDHASLSDAEILTFQCSPHEATSPLHPVAQTLRQLAGVEELERPAQRLDALVEVFSDVVDDDALARQILASLASIRYKTSPEVQTSPDKLRRETLDLLERFLIARCSHRHLVLVFEDVHWADPTTLRWLDSIIGSLDGLPAFVMVTLRQGHAWSARAAPHVTTLALTRLSRAKIAEMVAQQVEFAGLSPATIARIADRSEGIPLFAE
jgi:DNA-binding CsgD family transcriptional regulator